MKDTMRRTMKNAKSTHVPSDWLNYQYGLAPRSLATGHFPLVPRHNPRRLRSLRASCESCKRICTEPRTRSQPSGREGNQGLAAKLIDDGRGYQVRY